MYLIPISHASLKIRCNIFRPFKTYSNKENFAHPLKIVLKGRKEKKKRKKKK